MFGRRYLPEISLPGYFTLLLDALQEQSDDLHNLMDRMCCRLICLEEGNAADSN